ncbi:unnamed protein product [Adineta ricciae]|uniref:Integral membrane bound transporter domain-containing protein n=1 Tax=Adineta ricciae TaxID=249248 RepID=A0A816C3J2_ADIRI|nr:unnamed protein product [Adineta ricciae]CAF1618870.1 unnamed protein product [Adineta ricciae]
MIVAFVVSGLVSYGSPLRNHFDQQYVICVISVLSIQETFGSTLYSSIQTIIAILPLSILLFIIQIVGLSYHHYLATEILLLLLSLIIAYQCTQIQTRKIALLYNAIFFSTIVNQNSLPKVFVFLLLSMFIIGMSIAVLVSLFIFPLFATFDLEHRFSYCLSNLHRMYYLIVQGFLSRDRMTSKVSLSRASILEQMIRETMLLMQPRILEAKYEPRTLLKRLFYRKRKNFIDLNLQDQASLISSLMFHICSLQLMVNQCQFDEYHNDLRNELELSVYYLNSCQSSLISAFLSRKSVTNQDLRDRSANLSKAAESVRVAYKKLRLEKGIQQSEGHLPHGFFLFQLFYIVKLLNDVVTNSNQNSNRTVQPKTFSWRNYIQFDRARFLLALKSMIIIGVGSIFVMVPYLAKIFENGQWILIAMCMTQAETVGGAFTTMKMRLIGTLLGSMWSYITYLLVADNIFWIFLVLIPWIFLFGYLRSYPKWGYTAIVAAFTPILVTLGQLPYGDRLPAGNYALLRIEENFVAILISIVLTMSIFPVFAIDLLKESIQKSLHSCEESIDSMHKIFDELFHHKHSEKDLSKDQIKSFLQQQRSSFHQLINFQRILVSNASVEPTFCWFQNRFSNTRYNLIVQQQIDIFRMLHNIDATVIYLSEYSINVTNQSNSCSLFLRNIHSEIFEISQQIMNCLQTWSCYFKSSQTRCHYFTRGILVHRNELIQNDLFKHEQCLVDLHKIIHRLEHENIHQLFQQYQQFDLILLAFSSIYYSLAQLAQATLNLGTTIHEIFELEMTDLYEIY